MIDKNIKKSLVLVVIATAGVAVLHSIFPPFGVFNAAKRQDINTIKHYLDLGVDVNTVYGYSCTSLCWDYLSLGGETELIERGAGSGEWSYTGTLLDVVVAKNNKQMVQFLLDRGADINVPSRATPLDKSVSRENFEMVKFLLDRGANVNQSGTALHTAIYKGNKQMVELLLTHGADINAKSIDGWTPLYTAVASGDRLTSINEEIVELLLAHGAEVNEKDNDGNTPLHGALLTSQKNQKNIVKLLLDRGADINIKNRSGITPLYAIVGNFNYKDKEVKEMVELMLARGANVNVSNYWTGETLLDVAARSGKNETVKRLLAQAGNQ